MLVRGTADINTADLDILLYVVHITYNVLQEDLLLLN